MNIKDNILRRGNFDTFYSVLVEASKKKKYSNFILDDSIENFVYFKFLFDKVDDIKVFVEDVNYLVDIYQRVISCKEFNEDAKRKQALDDFWQSFANFTSNGEKHLQLIYKDATGIVDFGKFKELKEILSESNTTIQISTLQHDLSIVEGLNFFILAPKFNMVLTIQEIDEETVHVCQFYNAALYNTANEIYESFLRLSSKKSITI